MEREKDYSKENWGDCQKLAGLNLNRCKPGSPLSADKLTRWLKGGEWDA